MKRNTKEQVVEEEGHEQEMSDEDPEMDVERPMIEEEDHNAQGDGEPPQMFKNNLMNKLAGAILARAYLPSPKDIKQALIYADLSIKLQIVLFELSSSLFWGSLGEILLFIFAFLLFLTDASEMGGIWLHIAHVGRGVVGGLIVRKMPTYHQMVENIPAVSGQKVPFNQISAFLEKGAAESAKKFQETTSLFMKIYTGLTALCLILDLVQFFMQIAKYGADESTVFAAVTGLVLAFIYLSMDVYYFLWALSVKLKLPDFAATYIFLSLLGFISKLTDALNKKNQGAQPATNIDQDSASKASKLGSSGSKQRGVSGTRPK